MRLIGTCFAMAAVAATTFSPVPAFAFGLNIGPLHLGLPFFGFRHRHSHRHRVAMHRHAPSNRVYDRASPNNKSLAQGAERTALYPTTALPRLLDTVFWPANAPQWPFGYDTLFRSAFAKIEPGDTAAVCRQPDRMAEIVGRVRAEVRPNAAQTPPLEKLGQALGMAAGYMAKACPQTIPPQPVARLKLIQSQLQTLTLALDLVRPPLQQFEQSLDANQMKQFAALNPAGSLPACGAAPTATGWAVDEIDRSVQPNDAQRRTLADLKLTFASIAGDLHAHCPNPVPATPLARLEAIEARLDASWRAALAMQVALGRFETQLNDRQRTRLEAMNPPQAH